MENDAMDTVDVNAIAADANTDASNGMTDSATATTLASTPGTADNDGQLANAVTRIAALEAQMGNVLSVLDGVTNKVQGV